MIWRRKLVSKSSQIPGVPRHYGNQWTFSPKWQWFKYSFCCPTRVPPPGGGTWPGYPPRGGTWLGYPPGGVPDPGTPPGGYLTWVPPRGGTWPGYPPGGGPGTPPAASWHSGKCCKALWDMGTPPCGQTDCWMDRRVSKHYLPSYYVRGR